jgi:hypothetical protein
MLINSEAAIWSNIAACAITANTDKKLEKDQLPIVNQIGLKAVRICLAMKDLATVGIIKKCCTFSFSCSIQWGDNKRKRWLMVGNRGITLQSKLPPNEQDISSDEEVKKWKKQVELLVGCDDKSLFKDVESGKKVI